MPCKISAPMSVDTMFSRRRLTPRAWSEAKRLNQLRASSTDAPPPYRRHRVCAPPGATPQPHGSGCADGECRSSSPHEHCNILPDATPNKGKNADARGAQTGELCLRSKASALEALTALIAPGGAVLWRFSAQ